MRTSEKVENIAAALSKFQKEVPQLKFDATNPHFKNKYITLSGVISTIRGDLFKCGISIAQGLDRSTDGSLALSTRALHVSGEWIETQTPILYDAQRGMQALGSAITYARRYSLCSILNIAADEDDDAELAVQHTRTSQVRTAAQAAPFQSQKPLESTQNKPIPNYAPQRTQK